MRASRPLSRRRAAARWRRSWYSWSGMQIRVITRPPSSRRGRRSARLFRAADRRQLASGDERRAHLLEPVDELRQLVERGLAAVLGDEGVRDHRRLAEVEAGGHLVELPGVDVEAQVDVVATLGAAEVDERPALVEHDRGALRPE